MCNSLILGLVALEGGTAGEKEEGTWLGWELLEAGSWEWWGTKLAAGITQEHFPEVQHMRKKLTVINSAFYTFTLLGVFGEFLWQPPLLH